MQQAHLQAQGGPAGPAEGVSGRGSSWSGRRCCGMPARGRAPNTPPPPLDQSATPPAETTRAAATVHGIGRAGRGQAGRTGCTRTACRAWHGLPCFAGTPCHPCSRHITQSCQSVTGLPKGARLDSTGPQPAGPRQAPNGGGAKASEAHKLRQQARAAGSSAHGRGLVVWRYGLICLYCGWRVGPAGRCSGEGLMPKPSYCGRGVCRPGQPLDVCLPRMQPAVQPIQSAALPARRSATCPPRGPAAQRSMGDFVHG